MSDGHEFPFSASLKNGEEIPLYEVEAMSSAEVKVWVARVDESLIRNLQVQLQGVPGLRVAVYTQTYPVVLGGHGRNSFQPVVKLGKDIVRKYKSAGVFASLWLHAEHEGVTYTAQVLYGTGQRIDALLRLAEFGDKR